MRARNEKSRIALSSSCWLSLSCLGCFGHVGNATTRARVALILLWLVDVVGGELRRTHETIEESTGGSTSSCSVREASESGMKCEELWALGAVGGAVVTRH